ncbi:MAG: hypothetical protein AAF633_26115 [Chloroflexota bacterium]
MMYPDDRVLVAYMPTPKDFERLQTQGWYRIPAKRIPKGARSDYIAFYFGKAFREEKWAIHYYAALHGHELVRRIDIIPEEPDHPRAQEVYLLLQLGPLQKLVRPIISLRRRRVLFIHTTGDRFARAAEINDLVLKGEDLVNREFIALNEAQGEFK